MKLGNLLKSQVDLEKINDGTESEGSLFLAHIPTVNAEKAVSGRNSLREETVSDRTSILWNRISNLPSRLLALVIGMVILAWAYWPNLEYLYSQWREEPNYSHGFLVIPIALLIFWQRLTEKPIDWYASRIPGWGWVPLAVIIAARIVVYERNSQWLENATLVPVVACLILALGGWSLLERAWPAVLFLVFMLPLPVTANTMIALPLQRIATLGSVFVMQLTGLWAIAQGNVIILRDHLNVSRTLEVARACNGLSMLMTLAATVVAYITLIPLANWKRIVVLTTAIPIALVSNIVRIVATGWCYYFIDEEKYLATLHDWTGILIMMPLALILVGLELLLLSWLADDRHRSDEGIDRPVLPALNTRPRRQAPAPNAE